MAIYDNAPPKDGEELNGDAIHQLIFPRIYHPVPVVHGHGEAEAIFVPEKGVPFSHAYA